MYFGAIHFNMIYIILVIPAMLLSMWAQAKVSTTFGKYSKVRTARGLTGAQAARAILDANGLQNVKVVRIGGKLTDSFDPRENIIRLSEAVYDAPTVGAVGVAAHESGHAVQYARGYLPIKVRNAFVPVVNFGSRISVPLIILGFFLTVQPLVTVGLVLFACISVFQLITLPVEFNASSRALAIIDGQQLLSDEEQRGAKKVLSAAALTYVAAFLVSLMQLVTMILRYGGRRRNN